MIYRVEPGRNRDRRPDRRHRLLRHRRRRRQHPARRHARGDRPGRRRRRRPDHADRAVAGQDPTDGLKVRHSSCASRSAGSSTARRTSRATSPATPSSSRRPPAARRSPSLDGAGRVGTHAFIGRAGLDLTAQSGTHSLRLDLTSRARRRSPAARRGRRVAAHALAAAGRRPELRVGQGRRRRVRRRRQPGQHADADPERPGVHRAGAAAGRRQRDRPVGLRGQHLRHTAATPAAGSSPSATPTPRTTVNHSNRAYIGTDDGGGNIVADGVVHRGGRASERGVRLVARLDDARRTPTAAASSPRRCGVGRDARRRHAGRGRLERPRDGAQRRAPLAVVASRCSTTTSDATAGGAVRRRRRDRPTGDVDARTRLTAIRGGAAVTGFEGVDVRALNRGPGISEDVDGELRRHRRRRRRTRTRTTTPATLIDGDPDALVTAGPRLFPGPGVPAIDVTPLEQPAGFDRLALYARSTRTTARATSTGIPTCCCCAGPSPTLVVGPDGRIVKAINVSVVGVGSAIGADRRPGQRRRVHGRRHHQRQRPRPGAVPLERQRATPVHRDTALPNGPLFTFRETYEQGRHPQPVGEGPVHQRDRGRQHLPQHAGGRGDHRGRPRRRLRVRRQRTTSSRRYITIAEHQHVAATPRPTSTSSTW